MTMKPSAPLKGSIRSNISQVMQRDAAPAPIMA